jgi:glyoxylase-like metal-dependent hydrolase (beta-lactamase superfamily II)
MVSPSPAVQQQPPRTQAVAERIIQVRLPLPFALNHVNCYLLDDGEGWTLLDTGLHWPDAEAVWQQTLQALKIAPTQIHRIVLTHMHPDHFGMAGYFQQLTGAPILVGALEHAAIERIWIQDSWQEAAAVEFWRRAGLDEALCALVSEQVANLRQRTLPHPTDFVLIDPAQELVMGGRCFQPLLAPGHSDGQLIFYSAVDQLMLCGDQVLGKISPNIGLWPGGATQPLQHYLQSLAQLEQLAVTLALPGHGAPILTWRARIAALQAHHATRLAAMLAVVDDDRSGTCTALTVARQIFDFARFSEHEIRFAVAETLAHLAYLVAQGKLRQEIEAGRQIYQCNEPYR